MLNVHLTMRSVKFVYITRAACFLFLAVPTDLYLAMPVHAAAAAGISNNTAHAASVHVSVQLSLHALDRGQAQQLHAVAQHLACTFVQRGTSLAHLRTLWRVYYSQHIV